MMMSLYFTGNEMETSPSFYSNPYNHEQVYLGLMMFSDFYNVLINLQHKYTVGCIYGNQAWLH